MSRDSVLYHEGAACGRILDLTEKLRIPILIDPQVVAEALADDNPNEMSDADLEGLTRSIRELGFNQTPTVAHNPWRFLDGNHRGRIAKLLGLTQIPCIWIPTLKPGEEILHRIALNRWRGHVRQDIEQRQLSELIRTYHYETTELLVTGYSESELSALAGLQGAQLSDLTENLGNLTGSGSVPPEADESDDKEPTKMSAVLEIHFERVEDFKLAKRILRKLAKIGGVTKGNRVMETGILALIRQAEAE